MQKKCVFLYEKSLQNYKTSKLPFSEPQNNASFQLFPIIIRKNFFRSRPEVFCKKRYSETKACNFIKMSLWHWCFPVNFAEFLRTPFVTEHLWWLLFFLCINLSNCVICSFILLHYTLP